MKRSENLAYVFNSSSIITKIMKIIYESIWFPNVFQISNLNKDITPMAISRVTFVCHAMDHVGVSAKRSLRPCEGPFFEIVFQRDHRSLSVYFSQKARIKGKTQDCDSLIIELI